MEAIVHIDGLAKPRNPGIGTYSYIIHLDGRKVKEDYGLAGRYVTNNYAEYHALVMALKELRRMGIDSATVKSDSKLLVGQMGGKWKSKRGQYLEKMKEAKDLVSGFRSIKFEWIPRELNRDADMLTELAYEQLGRTERKGKVWSVH